MITSTEIRQLSDRDLADEISKSRDIAFRQKMGVRTKHLKDSHLIKILTKFIAQLLTETNRRKQFGEKVEKSDDAVIKKLTQEKAAIAKLQKNKTGKKSVKNESSESETKEIVEMDTGDIKVKKVEKKGLFGGKKKDS